MGAGSLIIILIVVALLVVAAVGVRRWGSARVEVEEELESPRTDTLEYVVPEGQDPVVVIAALQSAGFTTALDPRGNQLLRIGCPDGTEAAREQVRAIIEGARETAIDHGQPMTTRQVTFEDER